MEKTEKGLHPEYRMITVRTSDGSTIQGKVNVAARKRVSDLFTDTEEEFIVMVDVRLRESSGKVLFVNKHHIVWVEPED